MMFRPRRFRYSDPFKLSTMGRLRAGMAWLRGPATLPRWWLISITICVVLTVALAVTGAVMQAASPTSPASRVTVNGRSQPRDLKELLRAGPSSSNVVDMPGYQCRPMPGRRVFYLNPFDPGPSVIVIDRDGVVWGPSCVVSAGIAGV